MISNYNLTCDYHNFELKDKIYLIPDWTLKVIYTDGFNEVVFSGNSANVTILEGYDISFQEETSFDERFKFSKSVSIKVNGYKTFNDLDYRYCVVLETKEGEFYLVNVDFPSFVTHTYTLNNGTNSTELVFSSQSNIATLKLTNFNPNNVNSCKQYSNAKIKNVKLTEAWASYLSTWQKSLVNKGEFVDIEPLPDSISLTEEFDGEKYTVTLGFDIPMSYYKNDWHIKLLQFEENKYRGYIELEDGNVAFVGYNVGLFPSYAINGDIISIRLTETAIRGIAYGNDYVLIDTDIPNTIEYNGASCYTYNWLSTCDWHVEDKPEYITILPMSGNANTEYALQVCNTDDETGYAVSEFIIKTCIARVRPEVVIKNPIYRYTATTETVCSEITNERWVESGTTCTGTHGVDKWVNSVKLVSYDDGETWYNSGVESATTLIETNSPDCGYRTRTISIGTTCAGTHGVDKYQLIENQESYDYGSTWVTVSSSTGSLIETNSYDCGYRERWVESGYTCVGYSKYQNNIKQKSYDSGLTWSIKTPIEESASTLIEEYSEDCRDWENEYVSISNSSGSSSSITYSIKSTIYNDLGAKYGTYTRTIYYSNDYGNTWSSGNSVTIQPGETVFVHSTARIPGNTSWWCLVSGSTNELSDTEYTVAGNVLSLIYGSDYLSKNGELGRQLRIGKLFSNGLVNAENLYFPKKFYRTLLGAFSGLSKLIKPPHLPATLLPTISGVNPVTDNYGCYGKMFENCTSLVVAPELPATTLKEGCYGKMFLGCTSLTSAPVLSATTLTNYCYQFMFNGCTSLSAITCLTTDISAHNCTDNWVENVASSGTFTKATNMTNWPTGNSGIPSGWTVADYTG